MITKVKDTAVHFTVALAGIKTYLLLLVYSSVKFLSLNYTMEVCWVLYKNAIRHPWKLNFTCMEIKFYFRAWTISLFWVKFLSLTHIIYTVCIYIYYTLAFISFILCATFEANHASVHKYIKLLATIISHVVLFPNWHKSKLWLCYTHSCLPPY